MKSAKYFAIAAVITLMLTSCEKELDFTYHPIDAVPVIEATLTQHGCAMTVTYTTPMDEQTDSRHVTHGVTASLADLTSGREFRLTADAEGTFRSDEPGVPGHDYVLTVEIGDQTYASATRMQPSVEISDAAFYWITMPGDDMAALRLLFSDNPLSTDYYWVRVYRNGEAYSWSVITDRAAVDGMLEEVITTTHRDESQEDEKQLLRPGDAVTASVNAISRSMFDYLNALMNGSNGSPMFVGSASAGYFLASPVATVTIVYNPDEITHAQ